MFGYVVADRNALTDAQARRYQAYYCGVCRALGRLHGSLSRLTLSYDMAFLALLLDALYEEPGQCTTARCALHPTKHHDLVRSRFVDYAADICVALTYYNLIDNWNDDRSVPSLALAKAVESQQKRVAQQYPRQCAAIQSCLSRLSALEQSKEPSPERVAGCFGTLLGEIFVCEEDLWSDTLREIGFFLGKFIYLMDAYEDMPRDAARGSYNPLVPLSDQADYEARCLRILTTQMASCAAAFEKLPILQDADLLRNILYSGVWSRYHSLQKKQTEGESPE